MTGSGASFSFSHRPAFSQDRLSPDKLRELQDMFWAEAAKYNVLPLDDRFAERADPSLRPSLIAGRTHFTYFSGASRIPESSSANIKNKSHIITAYVDQPGDGVLY